MQKKVESFDERIIDQAVARGKLQVDMGLELKAQTFNSKQKTFDHT